ncbi:MAG: hypothetical protein ACI4PO_03660 [Faecousia sp.]
MKAWKVEEYCMYFPLFKLHRCANRFAAQPQTIYCESVAFTVKMDSNASGSPLAGQPPLMQNKYPCANVFHDLRRTEKRMGIYSEFP